MADIKISELPVDSTGSDTDVIAVVDSATGNTSKQSVSTLKTHIANALGIPADSAGVIQGTVAPSASTSGAVGDMYVDTVADKAYVCVDGTSGAKVWREVPTSSASTPVGVIATLTATQTNASNATIIFNQDGTVGSDIESTTCMNSGAYNKTTGIFTVPSDGVYRIETTLAIEISNSTGSAAYGTATPYITVTRGASSYTCQFDTQSSGYYTNEPIPVGDNRNFSVSVARTLKLVSGDTVSVKCGILNLGGARAIQGGGGYGRTMLSILKV